MNFIPSFHEQYNSPKFHWPIQAHHPLDLLVCLSLPAFALWHFFRRQSPSDSIFQHRTHSVSSKYHWLHWDSPLVSDRYSQPHWTKILSHFILFIQFCMKFFLQNIFICLFFVLLFCLGYTLLLFSLSVTPHTIAVIGFSLRLLILIACI